MGGRHFTQFQAIIIFHHYLYHTQVENVEHDDAHQQQQPHGINGSTPLNQEKWEGNETSHYVAVATITTKEIKMAILTLQKTPSV